MKQYLGITTKFVLCRELDSDDIGIGQEGFISALEDNLKQFLNKTLEHNEHISEIEIKHAFKEVE